MKNRYIVLIALGNFLLQTTLFPHIRILGIAPNTALVLVVITALIGGLEKGLVMGLAAGILTDLFLSKALAVHTLLYGSIALGIGLIEHKLFKDNWLTPSLLTSGATLLFYAGLFIILFFARESASPAYVLTRMFPLEALYNTGLCLIVYRRVLRRTNGYGFH